MLLSAILALTLPGHAQAQSCLLDTFAIGSATADTDSDVSSDGGMALGQAADSQGAGAVALGRDSSAFGVYSLALGTGASASSAGQFAIGTVSNTYTFAGITSAARLATQSRPLEVVTTDANGNLASDGAVIFDAIGQNGQGMEQANHGVALALAMDARYVPADQTFPLSAAFGTYQGSDALAFSGAWRPDSNVQVVMGFGMGLSSKKAGGRPGVTFGWQAPEKTVKAGRFLGGPSWRFPGTVRAGASDAAWQRFGARGRARPVMTAFEMLFEFTGGEWRVFGISIRPETDALPTKAEPDAETAQP